MVVTIPRCLSRKTGDKARGKAERVARQESRGKKDVEDQDGCRSLSLMTSALLPNAQMQVAWN